MKIMFLNAWYATTGDVLWNYIKEESKTTNIFCFMEADDEFREKCKEVLPDYILASTDKEVFDEGGCSQSTFVKKEIKILNSEAMLLGNIYIGGGLYTQIQDGDKIFHIASIHGMSKPGEKMDNPNRIEQSKRIIDFMSKFKGVKLIGGDFNLDFNTESVKMFEDNGYRNLIKEYKVDTTRNHLSWDRFNNVQLWADFLFVSPDVKVKSFEVPKNEVSDHLPLIVEIGE